MRSLRALPAVVVLALLAACNGSPAGPGRIHWTPRGSTSDPGAHSSSGQLPAGLDHIVPLSLPTDFFHFTGPTAPGTAAFADALVWDPMTTDMPPFGAGGGTADVTVGSDAFHVAAGDAMAMPWTDESGTAYLLLSTFAEEPDPAGGWLERNVFVAVLASDFAPGATVALDGTDRVAIFAAGPDTAPEPTTFAVAVTGTLTFGTGSIAVGDHVSATLAADFGPAESIAPPPPGGVALAAGDYDLVLDAAPEVLCGGTMAGHEASFAGATLADLGLSDGTVTVAFPAPEQLSIDGAAVGTVFGTPALLDGVASPADTFVALVDATGAGPDGMELAGAYALVEGRPDVATLAHAAFGRSYVDPAGDGGCDVVFHAELRAR